MWMPKIFQRNLISKSKQPVDPKLVVFCDTLREEFKTDKERTFKKLVRRMYFSKNTPMLRNVFKEFALTWYEENPDTAKEAFEKAKAYAGWDKTALTLKASERYGVVPSNGKFPDGILDEIVRESFLYCVAQETLNLMVPNRTVTHSRPLENKLTLRFH